MVNLQQPATKQDIAKLDLKIDNNKADILDKLEVIFMKFKSDFFDKIDPILKEVVASREERIVGSNQFSELTDRVERIEKHLGLPSLN